MRDFTYILQEWTALVLVLASGLSALLYSARKHRRLTLEIEQHRRQAEGLVTQRDELALANRELTEANRELAEGKAKAEETARARSEFLSNMSHELRTPLNGVFGMTNLLVRSHKIGDQERDWVTTIRQSCDHLLEIISDILDLSKIEAGAVELEERIFHLPSLLSQLIKSLTVEAELKGLELGYTIDPLVPSHVVGDPTRLTQVVHNLVGNALKFTREGTVSVAVYQHSRGAKESELVFRIQDTGIGIPEDKQATLFSAFSQADSSTSGEFGGTGLGLTISKHVVELMGGKIWFRSKSGLGSSFFFTVRMGLTTATDSVTPRSDAEDLPELEGEIAQLHPLSILVAEDDLINQKVIAETLLQMGYEPQVVGDGREALTAISNCIFDLVLLDLHMPDIDGFELAARLLAQKRPTRPRLVALTASATPEVRRRCLAAGMDGFLTKPIQVSDLIRILRGEKVVTGMRTTLASTPTQESKMTLATLENMVLDNLRSLGERTQRNLLTDLIATFRELTPQRLSDLRQALGDGDADEVRQVAHQLRGAAASIGVAKLAFVCTTIEEAAEEGNLAEVEELLGFLDITYSRALQALDRQNKAEEA
jgi:signal transduction histidine kinase/CheY-like chemotaxis protein